MLEKEHGGLCKIPTKEEGKGQAKGINAYYIKDSLSLSILLLFYILYFTFSILK